VISEKTLKEKSVELKLRNEKTSSLVKDKDLIKELKKLIIKA
jgi:hypothetical protein